MPIGNTRFRKVAISLPEDLKRALDDVTADEGTSRSDVIRASLRDYLFVRRFRTIRRRMVSRARTQGIHTDQDVFDHLSRPSRRCVGQL